MYKDALCPKKILIVDDEPRIRLLLEQTLEGFEDMGVEILTASNGRGALEIIRTERPGLVYLDAMMPEMNGYDVCNEVKNELALRNVYIVMLTAKGQEVDKKKGAEVGADMYITKPFDPDAIVVKTTEVLGIKLKGR
jgi:two-component system, OmpR family, alkaline phosphatase synthesis response regulator PhoP